MSISAEPVPLPNSLFFLKMCGEGGRFASPLSLPATDNDCCVESSAKAAGPEIVVSSAASLSYFLSQHLDEWRNEHISSNYDQVFPRWRYSCSLLFFPVRSKASKMSHRKWGPGRLMTPSGGLLTCGRVWHPYALRPFLTAPLRRAGGTWTSPSSSLRGSTGTAHPSTGRAVSLPTPIFQARA